MYTVIIIILAALTLFLIFSGAQKGKKNRIVFGIILGIASFLFFNYMDFYGEQLWFEALGYNNRFWTFILAESSFALFGALTSLLVVYLLTHSIPSDRKLVKILIRVLGFVIGGVWGFTNWEVILKFWNSESANIIDPILNMDAGFYLFTLPLLKSVYTLLLSLTIISIIALFIIPLFHLSTEGELRIEFIGTRFISNAKIQNNILSTSAFFILLLAFGQFLNRYDLLFSERGVVHGPGWTDVNIMLPAYWVVIGFMILLAVALIIPPLRKILKNIYTKLRIKNVNALPVLLGSVIATLFIVWFVFLAIIPGLFQWLVVEPNEITLEKQYIKNNIEMTRYGFNLNHIEEKEFPAEDRFTQSMVDSNQATLGNVRLWDYRALGDVYKQFQAMRLYYEFKDVDVDRYNVNGKYQQVMISAREMNVTNLPGQSQTFVNQRFKYTHGYGITMATVNDFTPEGLPNLLIKDIPPVSKYSELTVKRPQIYFGELDYPHVIVNTSEEEFDYPSGEKNEYIRYPGNGGVQISNIWRKFLFGWKFDGTTLFFSGYPNSNSRIMFHRNIMDRVKTIAPFLDFDHDPYIILSEGKLYWIIDAYTTSNSFPYSEPDENGINYIRNSVKVVVDAFDGSVDFYIYDKNDPIIKVWNKIYPGLFKKKEQMPIDIQKHVRYPLDFFLIQGLVYAKYHMTDPAVFYNQEDLWIRATEKYYDSVQQVAPYYIMWQLPGESTPQFVLMLPFTPKNRQVSIGWIAGMCDPDNYGKFIAYQFPKERRVLGPQQVETKIDQDSYLSGQLSLWNQRGSKVIRGNVLAIPIGKTLMYVEPIYLQAETAAYPELRLVAVMHNDKLSYAKNFDDALRGLYGAPVEKQQPVQGQLQNEEPKQSSVKNESVNEKIKQANRAFENYLRLQGEKKFGQAAQELERLQNLLQDMSNNSNGK